MVNRVDFIVIGAGIAGASVAYGLASRGRVLLLERESQPGYHATGRSAALFMESYGPPQVRALSRASRALFDAPPEVFGDAPLLTPRGALMVAPHGHEQALQAHWDVVRSLAADARRLDAAQACELTPVLRRECVAGAVLAPDAADMDAHAIHQGFLRGLRRQGGRLQTDAEVRALTRRAGIWEVSAGAERHEAPVVVDAAGAWADVVGAMAGARRLGLQPCRRSAFTFAPPDGVSCAGWPMTAGVTEDWYFKPDAGQLLASPANVDPVEPQDVQPEELDIALAIDRLQQMTTLTIRRPTRTWAGLRSFVADGGLVGGWDPQVEGFFWVAAQGGYGIQTAPAMGEACAALACGEPIPPRLAAFGVTAAMLGVERLGAAVEQGSST